MILISLLGQTCSGKSEMAIELALKLGNTWILNCDSRQIYQRLHIGTAKVPGQWEDGVFIYKDVPHFLIDYINPKKKVSIVDYVQDYIKLISHSNPLPDFIILTGGTGLYAKAILDQYQFGIINDEYLAEYNSFKNTLQSKSVLELQQILEHNDLDESGYHNPPRLINSILRQKASAENWSQNIAYPTFERTLTFTIKSDQAELKKRIINRIYDRLELGLVEEVEHLQDLGTARLLDLGLEYRVTQFFLLGQLNRDEFIDKLIQENWHYAKRQLTWLKKQKYNSITSVDEILTFMKSLF